MNKSTTIEQFKAGIFDSISNGCFIKVSLSNYNGVELDLKNIYVRIVNIKRADLLSFTFRYKTKDIVKNLGIIDGLDLIVDHINNGFGVATLFSTEMDFILEIKDLAKSVLRKNPPSLNTQSATSHNKEKKRLLIASHEKKYLFELGITDVNGTVFKNAQEKFKQINQFIELLSPMLNQLKSEQVQHVADMGSGKGYLTFALYDYMHQVMNWDTKVMGVEYRKDLVDLCNGIAINSGFNDLNFVQGTIQSFEAVGIDLLIALHACDTATDDAIYKGIVAGAKLIVVAPCCHKQIRKEIVHGKANNELDFLLKHGVFMERQAEMVTDGIRTLILEYFGYKTKIMEFKADVHTPKNVLIVGIKNKHNVVDKANIMKKINASKAYFGIGFHHLERLFGLNS
ncbi:hypothetical protein AAKU52_000108 [Pedobacter sp. CG_S7]|uniref:class I SAM-dependent methyltransferase n=1 Tax=Pedobacter sp. CG_S7 TaxID=3143930 RepID=UPI003395AAB3